MCVRGRVFFQIVGVLQDAFSEDLNAAWVYINLSIFTFIQSSTLHYVIKATTAHNTYSHSLMEFSCVGLLIPFLNDPIRVLFVHSKIISTVQLDGTCSTNEESTFSGNVNERILLPQRCKSIIGSKSKIQTVESYHLRFVFHIPNITPIQSKAHC